MLDFDKIESGEVDDIKILGVEASYWQDLYSHQGIAMARTLAKPVLVMLGDRDYQVSDIDIASWRKGLKGSRGFVAITLPGLNHLFMKGKGKPGPEEYSTPCKVEPDVIDRIAAFVKNSESF
ncbi:MAG: hypothetical protein H7318_14480 [Oligoflexus sp.]|nr:hypothetical protein [Oligoflexus sp.]